MNQIEAYWQAFLEESGKPLSCRYSYCDHFGDNETSAAILLELVLNGKKRATTSCMHAFVLQNEKVPAVGDYSILTDWNGTPRCIIQTTHLTVIPFCEMTFDVCRREGEDDCLESWRENHLAFFQEEGARLGYVFHDSSLILFEDFEVVYGGI